ncbi:MULTISPECIES: hypothetical protein [unclassified Crossiella]|uniref:hypothetical protein n=1 Tax=unclassified Crossiella TaxID=2620835 RepID=UPI001FFF7CAF|nr:MULTISPECIES: hypothetical protein [unclassified Crossiella]MCK2245128.1 hypothetical protein [Crossiella sp. S99.2]MCK2258781.1 hypothetical protein [Crossiella sp. S99.1]
MDEVRTLARAGEQVGRALGTGIHVVRKRAERAGADGLKATKRASRRAEKKLAKRGLTPHQLAQSVAGTAEEFSQEIGKRGRRARKELAKATKQAQKDLGRRGRKAKKRLADRLDPKPKRRKWPFAVLLLGAAGAVAAVLLARRPQEVKPVVEENEDKSEERPAGSPSDNGHRPAAARQK